MALEAPVIDALDIHVPLVEIIVPEKWYFTFGIGHRLFAGLTQDCLGDLPQRGISLTGRYVVLEGTADETRRRMLELFGRNWAQQYKELPQRHDVLWRELHLL